jgi:hypothetical protein
VRAVGNWKRQGFSCQGFNIDQHIYWPLEAAKVKQQMDCAALLTLT